MALQSCASRTTSGHIPGSKFTQGKGAYRGARVDNPDGEWIIQPLLTV